jgi:hypothetical protein
MAAGSAFGGSGVGAAVGGLGGAILGGLHGYHNAPKELIMRHGASPGAPAQAQPQQGAPPAEPPKTAQYDIYGFSTKEALAAPGLLGQMGSAVSRMGKATSIAAQRAGNAFQAERGTALTFTAGANAGCTSIETPRWIRPALTTAGAGAVVRVLLMRRRQTRMRA